MKKYTQTLLIALLTLLSTVGVNAQRSVQEVVSITDIRLTRQGEKVEVKFSALFSRKATPSNYTATIAPVIYTTGQGQVELPSFAVEGPRARISNQRKADKNQPKASLYTTQNGKSIDYKTTIDYQPWMENAMMRLDGQSEGCCSVKQLASSPVTQKIAIYDPNKTIPAVVPEIKPVEKPVERPKEVIKPEAELSKKYSFVAPNSVYTAARDKTQTGELFDYNMPLKMSNSQQREMDQFIDDNREGSLVIYFKQGTSVIERDFSTNNKTLVELVSAIREIENSAEHKVVKVIIAGFASPEGQLATNTKLAQNRAMAAREFILNNTQLKSSDINIYNGGVDWRGLRKMVAESDMYDKYQILDIIDNTPVWDSKRQVGRLGQIMRLRGGDPYRYIFKYFFPELRNAAYIKVYYEKK